MDAGPFGDWVPGLLAEIERHVRERPGLDRSQVVGLALRCWYRDTVHRALVRHHAATKSVLELAEPATWKQIRARRIIGPT